MANKPTPQNRGTFRFILQDFDHVAARRMPHYFVT
jgi:hypothetical protein